MHPGGMMAHPTTSGPPAGSKAAPTAAPTKVPE